MHLQSRGEPTYPHQESCAGAAVKHDLQALRCAQLQEGDEKILSFCTEYKDSIEQEEKTLLFQSRTD